jgi:hypothetical protein
VPAEGGHKDIIRGVSPLRLLRSRLVWLLLAIAAAALLYRLFSSSRYEYEEVLYLQLDGSATVNVNASVPALVALYGVNLDPRSDEAPDPEQVRRLFAAPGVEVSTPTFSRQRGRRFIHLSLEVDDIRQLTGVKPLAGSAFRLAAEGDTVVYRQTVGRPAPSKRPPDPRWTGQELVSFRVHVPSRIVFENASSDVLRGNILIWEQRLSDRLAGAPLDLHVEMEGESILYTTLTLFLGTVIAALLVFAGVIWMVVRKGRRQNRNGNRNREGLGSRF